MSFIHVLLIEDNPGDARLIQEMLKEKASQDFSVETSDNLADGLEHLAHNPVDVVLLDLGLPDSDGYETFSQTREQSQEVPIIVLTGLQDEELALRVAREHAQDYLVKDQIDGNFLIRSIHYAIERNHLCYELQESTRKLKASEASLRNIIKENADGIMLVDEAGTILFVNPALEELYGRSSEQLLGRKVDFPLATGETIEVDLAHNSLVRRAEVSIVETKWQGEKVLLASMHDITERKLAEEALQQSFYRLKKTTESAIAAMAKIVEIRDPYTAGHQRRVADLVREIAKEMGFPPERVEEIFMAAVIHDIGKICVPGEILSKPGLLTEIEFSMIRTHAQKGYDILKMVEFPWEIAQIVLQHHERLDGSGYPYGLSGKQILPEARIIMVADVVEAMAFHRPYRTALGKAAALEEISKFRDIYYDPDSTDACLTVMNKRGFDFED